MSIPISRRHGVNPTLGVCLYCKREDGTIGLLGALPGDAEAPRRSVISDEPCPACQEMMEQGVMLCEVKGTYQIAVGRGRKRETLERPMPTGTLVVVTEDWVRRMIQPDELAAQMINKRIAFVTPEDWNQIGLPREDADYREEVASGSAD